jgi:adenine-specific DNA methylase
MSVWHPLRVCIANTFDRHDFSFKWSHAEFDAAHNLFPWVIDQVIDAYKGLADLTKPAQLSLFRREGRSPMERLQIGQGNAADLSHLPDGSVHLICVDPPYYANVMYAELADFFYVWQKRLLQDTFPELFQAELTDKEEEAVANVARFASFGRKRQDLARADYERKMAACFREWRRVLKPEGVLTVMFTHKEAAAWDTLATALLAAGFVVQASWPVHTESEHSLHQVKKSAAASTIILVCRKRPQGGGAEPAWWDDLQGTVRRVAREKAQEFQEKGIAGVDLYLSTYGPVLSVISQKWPVLTSELDPHTGKPRPLKPEEALNLARQEVFALRKQGLLLGRSLQFDPVTDWYLFAWDAFKAGEFPADEARKLALSLGLDLEETLVQKKRLLTKKQNYVAFTEPRQRRKKDMVDPEVSSFPDLIDAVHTAMLLYQEEGSGAVQRFLQRTGLLHDDAFKNCLQALLNAIPRTQDAQGRFLRLEAELVEKLRLAFFPELTVPAAEEAPALVPRPRKLALEELPEEEQKEEDEE